MPLLRWWSIPVRDDPILMLAAPLVLAGAASAIVPPPLVVAVWVAATGHFGVRTVARVLRALGRRWRLGDEPPLQPR